MWNSSTNIDDLRTLLERLYPDVYISSSGVALLAAQIRNLENNCDLIGNRIDQPGHNPVTMAPTLHWRNDYGANNHPK